MPEPQTRRAELTGQRKVRPTSLKSDEIRDYWDGRKRNQAIFSARTTSREYLEKVKTVLMEYQDGIGEAEEGATQDTITQGRGRARMQLLEKLQDLGLHTPEDGDSRRLTDLASSVRLNLVIETNAQVAHSLDMMESSSGPVQKVLFPAWEFVRDEHRNEPRDWATRWEESAAAVGYVGVARNAPGRMIALKDSPVWARLGSYPDGLGNPFPPFAFGSGMGWEEIDKDEWRTVSGGVHTPEQDRRIQEYQAAVDPKAVEYYKATQNLTGKEQTKHPKFTFAEHCPPRMAAELKKMFGIDVSGWPVRADATHSRHTEIRHGKQGAADQSMDPESFARTRYVIDHFDYCEPAMKDGKPMTNGYYNSTGDKPAPQAKFTMQIDGQAVVQEAVQDAKAKTIWIVSSRRELSEAEKAARAARRAFFKEWGKRNAQGKR